MIHLVIRRFVETILVGIISSMPAYLFLRDGAVHMSAAKGVLLFMFTALIFGALSIFLFRKCVFILLDKNMYVKVNLYAIGVAVLMNILFLFAENRELYISFFAYTKCIKAFTPEVFPGVLRTFISLLFFWSAYTAEMYFCPKLFGRQIRIMRECAEEYQSEE